MISVQQALVNEEVKAIEQMVVTGGIGGHIDKSSSEEGEVIDNPVRLVGAFCDAFLDVEKFIDDTEMSGVAMYLIKAK